MQLYMPSKWPDAFYHAFKKPQVRAPWATRDEFESDAANAAFVHLLEFLVSGVVINPPYPSQPSAASGDCIDRHLIVGVVDIWLNNDATIYPDHIQHHQIVF